MKKRTGKHKCKTGILFKIPVFLSEKSEAYFKKDKYLWNFAKKTCEIWCEACKAGACVFLEIRIY